MPVDQTIQEHKDVCNVSTADRTAIHTGLEGEPGRLYYDLGTEELYYSHNDGHLEIVWPTLAGAPFIEKLDKSCVQPSTTTTVIIEGKGFTTATTFDAAPHTFTNYVYISPCEIQVDIVATAATGYVPLTASNGTSTSAGFTGGINQLHVSAGTLLEPGIGGLLWQNITGAGVTGGAGFLQTNSGTAGWNKQGTFGVIAAGDDFTLSFNLATRPLTAPSGYGMYGFGIDPTANTSYNTIDHAFYIQNQNATANVYIYENGANRGLQGTASVGALFEIKRTGGVVTYHLNGTLTYTSPTASTGAVHFDSSMYRNQRIENIKMEAC